MSQYTAFTHGERVALVLSVLQRKKKRQVGEHLRSKVWGHIKTVDWLVVGAEGAHCSHPGSLPASITYQKARGGSLRRPAESTAPIPFPLADHGRSWPVEKESFSVKGSLESILRGAEINLPGKWSVPCGA